MDGRFSFWYLAVGNKVGMSKIPFAFWALRLTLSLNFTLFSFRFFFNFPSFFLKKVKSGNELKRVEVSVWHYDRMASKLSKSCEVKVATKNCIQNLFIFWFIVEYTPFFVTFSIYFFFSHSYPSNRIENLVLYFRKDLFAVVVRWLGW